MRFRKMIIIDVTLVGIDIPILIPDGFTFANARLKLSFNGYAFVHLWVFHYSMKITNTGDILVITENIESSNNYKNLNYQTSLR